MARPRGLRRIEKLYAMVEGLHAMQVKAAAAAVFEVEQAAENLKKTRKEDAEIGRAALEQGSRVEAIAAEASALNDPGLLELLARLKEERRQAYEAAREVHRESRMELRQIEGMVERLRARQLAEEERRAQLAADDRFLSRREWTRAKQEREAVGIGTDADM